MQKYAMNKRIFSLRIRRKLSTGSIETFSCYSNCLSYFIYNHSMQESFILQTRNIIVLKIYRIIINFLQVI